MLSSIVRPMSVRTSHNTVSWFCVIVSTVLFYNLSNVCHYLTLYVPLVLCHYVDSYLLQSVNCLSVPHTVPSVGSLSPCLLLSSTFCPLTVCTSHCNICCFCVTMSTAVLNVLHCLSVHHTLPSLGSVSVCPLLCSTVCPLPVSTSHLTVCPLSIPHTVHSFGSVSLFPLLSSRVLHCLSVHHTLPSLDSEPLCPLLCSTVRPLPVSTSHLTVCPLSVSTSHFTVPWFWACLSTAVFHTPSSACQYHTFNSLSTVCQYLTLYAPLALFHYVHSCLLQSVHCLSILHSLPYLGFVSPSPPLSYIVSPLYVNTVFWLSQYYLLRCCSNTLYHFTVTVCTVAIVKISFKFSALSSKERVFFVIGCWVLTGNI